MRRKTQGPQTGPTLIPRGTPSPDLAADLETLERLFLSLSPERKARLFELLTTQLIVEAKRLLRPAVAHSEERTGRPTAAQPAEREPVESALATTGKLLSTDDLPAFLEERLQGRLAEERLSFERARDYYRDHFEELLSQYSGKYIAVLDDQVVDSDSSFHDLATRVYAKYGYRDMFMPKVVRDRVVYIRSPRRAPLPASH